MNPTIFDRPFNGMPGAEAIQSMVFPDLFKKKNRKRMHLENWDIEDVSFYCGPGEAAREVERRKEEVK